jgi:hypothetical protein
MFVAREKTSCRAIAPSRWILGFALAFHLNGALAAEITPGAPAFPGVDTFVIHDQLTHQDITINVPITPAIVGSATPAAAKQSAIIQAALAAGVPTGAVFAVGGSVRLIGYSAVRSVIRSGEASTLTFGSFVSDTSSPNVAALDYEFLPGFTALSGLDVNGGVATYSAGFEFTDSVVGDVTLSSTMSFASLATPTIDTLLEDQIAVLESQLLAQAPSLAGILSLDLANDSIDIRFPSTVVDASVMTDVTDVSLAASQSIGAAPEPSTWAMLISGVGLIGLLRRRRRDALARVA